MVLNLALAFKSTLINFNAFGLKQFTFYAYPWISGMIAAAVLWRDKTISRTKRLGEPVMLVFPENA